MKEEKILEYGMTIDGKLIDGDPLKLLIERARKPDFEGHRELVRVYEDGKRKPDLEITALSYEKEKLLRKEVKGEESIDVLSKCNLIERDIKNLRAKLDTINSLSIQHIIADLNIWLAEECPKKLAASGLTETNFILFLKAMAKKYQLSEEQTDEPELTLADIFQSISKYKIVMELLVKNGFCAAGSYVWIYEHRAKSRILCSLLIYLSQKKYYKRVYSMRELSKVTLPTFHLKVSDVLFGKADPRDDKLFSFIKHASEL